MTWTLIPYDLPMRPVKTSRGVVHRRQGFWLGRKSPGGMAWGEVACWEGFGDGYAACAQWLDEQGVEQGRSKAPAEIRAAMAQVELICEAELQQLPVCRLLSDQASLGVASHAPVTSAFDAQMAVEAGATALKIKVGVEPIDDEGARVMAIRSAVGPNIALRLDANGAWPVSVATQAARLFAAASPEWLEQPVEASQWQGITQVRRDGGCPIYLDESLREPLALEQLHAAGAIDGVVIKPAFLGGPAAAVALGHKALAWGLGVCVTHAFESPVGRLAALHVALALGPEARCGLVGGLLEHEPGPWHHHRYVFSCPRRSGLGWPAQGWTPQHGMDGHVTL